MDYKSWCNMKGYKPSNAKALNEYCAEITIQKSRFIKSKMSLFGDTIESLADYLGIARQTLSRKINCETDFTIRELAVLRNLYELTDEEYLYLCTKELVGNEYTRSSEAIK